jgi:hypothetical protein
MVRYKLLILESMLGADGHDGLVRAQSWVGGLAGGSAPCHFLLEHVEQSNDISKTALSGHIAISDRDHDHLKVLGVGAKRQQQGEHIINTWMPVLVGRTEMIPAKVILGQTWIGVDNDAIFGRHRGGCERVVRRPGGCAE